MRRSSLVAAVLTCGLFVLLAPTASGLPTLTKSQAQYYTRKAIVRNFGSLFYAGGYRRICKRASRIRFRCAVSWFNGDFAFSGRVVIWLDSRDGDTWWNYAYGITRFDEYCALVQNRPVADCVKRYRVR